MQNVNCWATVRTCAPGAAMWLSISSGQSLPQQRSCGHNNYLYTGRTVHFILRASRGARVALREVRRAKSGISGGVLAAATTVQGSAVLWVWMCEVVFHHSQGLLFHRHMAYLGPSTHNTQCSAPNHPTRHTAKVLGAAEHGRLLSLMCWFWIMQLVSTWLVGRNGIHKPCGLVNCRLTVFLYSFSPCRQTSW